MVAPLLAGAADVTAVTVSVRRLIPSVTVTLRHRDGDAKSKPVTPLVTAGANWFSHFTFAF